MASNTPRQRQYHAAVTAQQHNLANDLQTTLHNLTANVPPVGDTMLWEPIRLLSTGAYLRASVAQLHNLGINLQETLYNLAVNVPPVGVRLTLDRFTYRNVPHPLDAAIAQTHNLATNLQTTLLNEGVNVPPDGKAELLDRFTQRNRIDPTLPGVTQQHNLSTNLHGTLYNLDANVPPDGVAVFDTPPRGARRLGPELWPQNPQGTIFTAPVENQPDGKALLADPAIRVRPSRAQFGQPGANLELTLLNEAANVPPEGERLYPEALRAASRIRQADIPPNLQAMFAAATPGIPDGRALFWERRDAVLVRRGTEQPLQNMAPLYAKPDGMAVLWDRSAAPRQVPPPIPVNLHDSLYNEGANVPPAGQRLLWERFGWRARTPHIEQIIDNRQGLFNAPVIVIETPPWRVFNPGAVSRVFDAGATSRTYNAGGS